MNTSRPDWDQYFLEMARVAASRSTCLRANVGAVIVDSRKKIKSSGYNGPPHGVKSCKEIGSCYRLENNIQSGTRYETCRSIHAEQNAIIQAGEENCIGSTIYIYGHEFACILCKRFIVQSGIKRVVLQKDEKSSIKIIDTETWRKEL